MDVSHGQVPEWGNEPVAQHGLGGKLVQRYSDAGAIAATCGGHGELRLIGSIY